MSYIEKTAKKLLPILFELKKRMTPDKKKRSSSKRNKSFKSGFNDQDSASDDEDLLLDLV